MPIHQVRYFLTGFSFQPEESFSWTFPQSVQDMCTKLMLLQVSGNITQYSGIYIAELPAHWVIESSLNWPCEGGSHLLLIAHYSFCWLHITFLLLIVLHISMQALGLLGGRWWFDSNNASIFTLSAYCSTVLHQCSIALHWSTLWSMMIHYLSTLHCTALHCTAPSALSTVNHHICSSTAQCRKCEQGSPCNCMYGRVNNNDKNRITAQNRAEYSIAVLHNYSIALQQKTGQSLIQ